MKSEHIRKIRMQALVCARTQTSTHRTMLSSVSCPLFRCDVCVRVFKIMVYQMNITKGISPNICQTATSLIDASTNWNRYSFHKEKGGAEPQKEERERERDRGNAKVCTKIWHRQTSKAAQQRLVCVRSPKSQWHILWVNFWLLRLYDNNSKAASMRRMFTKKDTFRRVESQNEYLKDFDDNDGKERASDRVCKWERQIEPQKSKSQRLCVCAVRSFVDALWKLCILCRWHWHYQSDYLSFSMCTGEVHGSVDAGGWLMACVVKKWPEKAFPQFWN